MELSVTIDWLSFTQKEIAPDELPFIPDFHDNHQKIPTTPRFGYTKAIECECGLVVYSGSANNRMGAHYVYSGSALGKLLDEGTNPLQVNDYHRFLQHTCTRLDLALDVKNCAELNKFIYSEVEANRWWGKARSATIVKSTTGPGQTVYVGSRQSEVFLRMYDKGAEQHTEDVWTRLEVELKRSRAESWSGYLGGQSELVLGQLTRLLIAEQCSFEGELWSEIVRTAPLSVSRPQARLPNRAKWLIETCAPSLGKELAKSPDLSLWFQFVEAVQTASGISEPLTLIKLPNT